jgi:hypothetical protein
MSIDTCSECDEPVDTDKETYAYPYADEPLAPAEWRLWCICERCQERAYDRHQERLMEESP